MVASRVVTIGIIAISVAVGFIVFYILSEAPKEEKKKQIDELMSLLLYFIVFIWIGKILLNFPLFIEDPLAILAYPSEANAFYLAVLFTGIIVRYKTVRNKLQLIPFANRVMFIFFATGTVYEFIQFAWNNYPYAFGNFVLFSTLFIIVFILRGRWKKSYLLGVGWGGFVIGMYVLNIVHPYVTLFGYMMNPSFIALLFVVSFGTCIFAQHWRKNG